MKAEISAKAKKFVHHVSPVREIMAYADRSYIESIGLKADELISFAGGWVNHRAPDQLRAAYVELLSDPESFHETGGYSPTRGLPACKQAIVRYEQSLFDVHGLDSAQVVIGASSTQLTYALMHILLDPGDGLLLLDPSYCNLPMQALSAQDVSLLRFPVLDVETWDYVADEKIVELQAFILDKRPKVVFLIAPDNPSSQIPSTRLVRAVKESVEEIGSFLVIDFAYKTLTFDEDVPEYFSWPPDSNYLSIHSNSKWAKNLGRRLGWIQAPEHVAEALESHLSSTILCPDTLHQLAFTRFVQEATRNDDLKEYVRATRRKYETAARHTVKEIEQRLGFPCLVPQGGLYTCMKVDREGSKFVEDVLAATGVLFVPGWGFGRSLQNAVRISYGPLVDDLDRITEGIQKVSTYLGR